MREDVKTISSELWSDFDEDAKKHNMDRSQFHDYVYRKWKKNTKRPRLIEVAMLLLLALACVLIIVVK